MVVKNFKVFLYLLSTFTLRRKCGKKKQRYTSPYYIPAITYGIGDFGKEAYWFVDILAENNQSFWQILPLNQTCAAYGNSPYSSFSAYAGNTILISPDVMVEDGILLKSDVENHPSFSGESVDYGAVTKYKEGISRIAFEKKQRQPG